MTALEYHRKIQLLEQANAALRRRLRAANKTVDGYRFALQSMKQQFTFTRKK